MLEPREIGALLKRAREAWELSDRDLARRADVSVKTVRDGERTGRLSLPDLVAIATAMGGSMDDVIGGREFWRATSIALKNSDAKFDLAVVRSHLIALASTANDGRGLAQMLELPDEWAAKGASLGPVSLDDDVVKQAEVLARQVRERVNAGIEPISSIRGFCAQFGVPAFLVDLGTQTVDGIMWRERGAAPCIAANVIARGGSTTAIRMTLAHELCHALFDRPKIQADGILEERSHDATGRERRANAFAAYLLAPRKAVLDALRRAGRQDGEAPSQHHLRTLSQFFGMGVESMAFHLVSCGVWSQSERSARVSFAVPYTSHDDREHTAPTLAERQVPLERRGHVLDLATEALSKGAISVGRWRELLRLDVHGQGHLLLAERHVES